MIRRPRGSETEQELLKLQEEFLSSGEKSSASLKAVAGEKRRSQQQPLPTDDDRGGSGSGRDVVNLTRDEGKPQVKKSKFRERRERELKNESRNQVSDPFEAMESQDTHITKVLADIKETSILSGPVPMATKYAKHGFPLVRKLVLDPHSSAGPTGTDGRTAVGKIRKKKSLFAEQFEDKDASFFGIDVNLSTGSGISNSLRDYVEPISIGMEIKRNQGMESSGMEVSAGQDAMECGEEEEEGCVIQQEHESMASKTWDRYRSSLITGDGLLSMGKSGEDVKAEMSKIHQENMDTLLGLKEEVLLQEKREIEQRLRPDLLAFLKSRQKKPAILKDEGGSMTEERTELSKDGLTQKGELTQDGELRGFAQDGLIPQEGFELGGLTPPPQGWVHMNVVEKEKLEWMADLPPPPPPSSSGLQEHETRFGLDGRVIHRGEEVPTHLGLHHHGDEPQAAGYTLNELLPLCRSAVLQQRILSLQTISKIIHRARAREYESLVVGGVVQALLGAGLPLLLRYALDENVEAVVVAALQALYSLLVVPGEEAFLDEFFLAYSGPSLPALRPHGSIIIPHNKGGEEEEESDAAILRRDIIDGYLKMSFLPRIRYVLEVLLSEAFAANVSIRILHILTRFCRHSTAAATQVLNCPRLMQVIFDRYLPLHWPAPTEKEKGKEKEKGPQVAAVKLVRALSIAGRNISSHLISDYHLLSVLTRYSILHPTEMNLPQEEAYHLSIASLSTWQVLLGYGLGDETLRDIFPVFLKQIQLFPSPSPTSSEPSGWENKRMSALFNLMESVVSLAAVTPEQLRVVDDSSPSNQHLQAPSIEWSHADIVIMPLVHALTTCLDEGVASGEKLDDVIGSLFHVVATYYSKLGSKVGGCPLKVLEQVELLVAQVVNKVPETSFFSAALNVIRNRHVLGTTLSSTTDYNLPSLPSHFTPPLPARESSSLYPRDQDSKEVIQGTEQQRQEALVRSANLVLGFLRLCSSLAHLHKGVLSSISWIFTNQTYRSYLRACSEGLRELSLIDYLNVKTIHHTLSLFRMWAEAHPPEEGSFQFFQETSFLLLASIPSGLQHIAHDILSTIIFSPIFYSKPVPLEKDLTELSLVDPVVMDTSLGCTRVSTRKLLSGALSNHSSIKDVYLKSLHQVLISKESIPLKCGSFLLPAKATLLPSDWILYPIILEYEKSLAVDKCNYFCMGGDVVNKTLSFLLLLESLCPQVLSQLSLASKLTRLMCIFLIDNDLFLDNQVHSLLYALMKSYCKEEMMESNLDFSSPVPGLFSFLDLYRSFLEHFTAVSYGNHLFGSFVLLPLQQRFPVSFRKLLWEDYPQALRILSVPLEQFPLNVNLFLQPVETDGDLLWRYISALVTAGIKKSWSPLLYCVAVHHVHSYIFRREEEGEGTQLTPLQRKLLTGVLCIKDETLRKDLLFYAGGYSNSSTPDFETHSELDGKVKAILKTVTGKDYSELHTNNDII